MDVVLFESVVFIEIPLPEDEDIVLEALLQLKVNIQVIHSRLDKLIDLSLL